MGNGSLLHFYTRIMRYASHIHTKSFFPNSKIKIAMPLPSSEIVFWKRTLPKYVHKYAYIDMWKALFQNINYELDTLSPYFGMALNAFWKRALPIYIYIYIYIYMNFVLRRHSCSATTCDLSVHPHSFNTHSLSLSLCALAVLNTTYLVWVVDAVRGHVPCHVVVPHQPRVCLELVLAPGARRIRLVPVHTVLPTPAPDRLASGWIERRKEGEKRKRLKFNSECTIWNKYLSCVM